MSEMDEMADDHEAFEGLIAVVGDSMGEQLIQLWQQFQWLNDLGLQLVELTKNYIFEASLMQQQ